MVMKKIFLLLFVFLLLSFLFLNEQPKKERPETIYSFLPLGDSACSMVSHTYYALCYSEKHEQAAWVYYVLNDSMIVENVKKSYFLKDSLVVPRTLSHSAYTNSGYARGHLLPAADMNMESACYG
jgi:endonuclease G